ncbi:hypothetical protein [Bilifractor porci]|uniref:Tape measure protein n=1 Tax=Bilifractor porci TaxID=2606636 RepID=A0A7X2P7I0_9FIRM|nr:hypothetical protein [Bilifractor porci]MST81586.1 hypothetical protein [Bilifractor porci]
MSDNTIDRLGIEVVSNARQAQQALEGLSSAMKRAARVSGQFNSAERSVLRFSASLSALSKVNLGSTISQLREISDIDISKLNKTVTIDIKLKGADEASRLPQAIQSAIDSTKVDSKKITNQIAKAFHITGADKKEIQSNMDSLVSSWANGVSNWKTVERIPEIVMHSGSVARADFDESISGMREEYQQFLDYMNSHQFRVGAGTYGSEWNEKVNQTGMFKYFTKTNKQVGELDGSFRELEQMFPTIFTADDAAAQTEEDQLDRIIAKINEARDAVSKKPISLYSQKDQDDIYGKFFLGFLNDAKRLRGRVDSEKQSALASSEGKIPIDVQIDESRIETQIQQAINRATSRKYDVKSINLNVDTSTLTNSIASVINGIDMSKLPVIADNMQRLAQSIGVLKTANLKDTGITQFANSLTKLSSADMSGFDSSVLDKIVDTVQRVSKLGDVSANINRLVSALARLANAGDKTQTVASSLPQMGVALKGVVETMQNASGLPDEINQFVSSLAKLATAGSKAQTTSDNLATLGDAIVSLAQKLNSMPQINDNVNKFVSSVGQIVSAGSKAGSAARGIQNAASSSYGGSGRWNAVTQVANGISNKFNAALRQSVTIARSAKSSVDGFFNSLKLGSSGINSISAGIKTMIASMLGFQGIVKLFNLGKQAITWGSDITELENVVDVAFGNLGKNFTDLSGKIYEFAQNSQEQYGISEIAARRYTGTLMSMFNSSGFDASDKMHKEAAQMSLDLTKLSGDLASFYNIPNDEAFQKIQSGMAGMVRPLRDLGINMSVANLDAYAMSQGIGQSYREMSQANQQMLRYSYLMSVTSAQQGDFARTSNTYANQMRILKLNFQQLAATIGQGLISAIAPAIHALNVLMKYLIAAANAFRNFMYTLFGKVAPAAKGISTGLGGLGDDADNLATGADNAASGLGDAADNAKKLKKELSVLPFDELNQLNKQTETPKTSTGGSGGGGGAGGGSGLDDLLGFDVDQLTGGNKTADAINKWAKKIKDAFLNHDWYGVGATIADMLNTGLAKLYGVLNSPKLKRAIDHFTSAIAQGINGFVDNFDWELLGRAAGSMVNRFVQAFNGLVERINWRNIGSCLAKNVNGLVDEIDWKGVGNAIGNGIMVPWRMANGFVHGLKWDELGRSLGNLINGANQKINWSVVADTLTAGINGAFVTLKNFTASVNWKEIADNIVNGINTFISRVDWKGNARALNQFIQNLLDALVDIVKRTDWEAVGNAIGTSLQNIDWGAILQKVVTILWDAFSGIMKGMYQTPAGAIAATLALAVGAVKTIAGIDNLLVPFVNVFSSTHVDSVLAPVIKSALGNVLKKAGIEGISDAGAAVQLALESMLSSTVGTVGLITAVTAVGVGGIKLLADAIDGLQGGNGKTTIAGSALHSFVGELESLGQISQTSADQLWSFIEQEESAGKTTSQIADDVMSKLSQMGVSSDGAKTALNSLSDQGQITADSVDAIGQAVNENSSKLQGFKGELDFSNVNAKQGLSDVRQALVELSTSADDWQARGVYRNILSQFDDTRNSGITAQDGYAMVINSIKDAGLATDEFSDKLSLKYAASIDTAKNSTDNMNASVSNLANSGDWQTVYDRIGEISTSSDGMAQEFSEHVYPVLEESREHGQTVQDSLNNIQNAVTSATTDMSGKLDAWQNEVLAYHDQIKTTLENTATDWGTLDANQSQSLDSLNANLENSIQNQQTALSNMEALNNAGLDKATVQAILNQIDPSTQAMSDLIGHLQAGDGEWEAFHSKIQQSLDMQTDIQQMADKMTTDFATSTAPAFVTIGDDFKTQGGQIGGFLVKGVSDGVFNNVGDAKTAMSNLSDNIIKQINSDLGIHSPSIVMIEKGKYIVQGLANGVASNYQFAVEAINVILGRIRRIVDYFNVKKEGAGITKSLCEGISSESSTVISGVNGIVKSIGDALSNVSFYNEGYQMGQSLARGFSSVDIPTPHLYVSAWSRNQVEDAVYYTPNYGVSWYERGGLFKGGNGQIIGVAENGKDEAVIPLEDNRAMSKIAESIISAGGMNNSMNESAIERAVERGMANALSSGAIGVTVYSTLQTDDETLARSVSRGQEKINYRYNK